MTFEARWQNWRVKSQTPRRPHLTPFERLTPARPSELLEFNSGALATVPSSVRGHIYYGLGIPIRLAMLPRDLNDKRL